MPDGNINSGLEWAKGLAATEHLRSADEAKAMIKKETGSDLSIRLSGFRMLILLPVRPQKSAGGILFTDNYRDLDPRKARTALVIAMGPECYTGFDSHGNPKFPKGPYCKEGDWIIFDRYDATASLFKYRGKFAMAICVDERISGVCDGPGDIVPIRMEDLY